MKFALLTLLCGFELFAQITLSQLEEYPTSRAKDFYIWQYLKQDITPYNAKKAYSQLEKYNRKIFFEYAKKSSDTSVKYDAYCQTLNSSELLNENNSTCILKSFSVANFLRLSDNEQKLLYKKLKDEKESSLMNILLDENLSQNYRKYEPKDFTNVFVSSSTTFRENQMNFDIEFDYLNEMSKNNYFGSFVSKTLTNKNMDKTAKSLLKIKENGFDSQTDLFLALNFLKNGDIKKSLEFLEYSKNSAKSKIDKNRAMFWMYQITDDLRILSDLIMSFNIDIYSLYAYESLHVEPKNYITDIKTSQKKIKTDLQNPFVWNKIRTELKSAKTEQDLRKLLKKYNYKDVLVVKSLILEKLSDFKENSYIMPYDKYLQDVSSDEKALVYALMRQESQFIPSALSRSFALGVMQLMPFLVDALNKKLSTNRSYDDMFNPKYNIQYSLQHLKWLQSKIKSPLFIAYAYNGGYGFLRSHLKDDTFTNEKYEPFLSIELMGNSESREYGKKVLANYVMYKKILGEGVSINEIFQTLLTPNRLHSIF